MKNFLVSHVADHVLLRELHALVLQDRATTAALLAHLAEVDERKLYLAKAYSSMYLYCVGELRMSEDSACRRIQVARMAKRFRTLFPMLSDGRLNMTAVLTLGPHFTSENADELMTAAAGRSKEQLRLLLAERFPQPDVPTLVQPVGMPVRPVAPGLLAPADASNTVSAPARIEPAVPVAAKSISETPRPRLAPLSPGRYALQVTVNQRTHELLQRAKALLAHAQPACDVADVLERALEGLVERLEKQKFAKSSRTTRRRSHANGRYVPAEIKRAVHQRDGGRCTFVGDNDKRCDARERLEFDHAQPLARGGRTTADNLRLRCRAHNQFEAERVYGAGFMRMKRGLPPISAQGPLPG